jgi:hypothetical protein
MSVSLYSSQLLLAADAPEPFAAVLATMLYPNDGEAAQRGAFAAQYLAEPIRRYGDSGGRLSYDVLSRLVKDCGARLNDLDQRWQEGALVGELFKVLFALANGHPERASWEHAARIVERVWGAARVPRARTSIMAAKQRLLRVAHLWGAFSIRGRAFRARPEVDYSYVDDFESFLAEAEILRKWGQCWQAKFAKAKPPLPAEVWGMPATWAPPSRKPGWPMTGMIPEIILTDDLLSSPGRRGRPRRAP